MFERLRKSLDDTDRSLDRCEAMIASVEAITQTRNEMPVSEEFRKLVVATSTVAHMRWLASPDGENVASAMLSTDVKGLLGQWLHFFDPEVALISAISEHATKPGFANNLSANDIENATLLADRLVEIFLTAVNARADS